MTTMLAFDQWKARAESLKFEGRAFIGGQYVDARSGQTFDCISPRSGQVIAKVAACDEADVERAVKAARAAFEKGHWRKMAAKDRKTRLLKFADLIETHAEELALLETLDMGKPIKYSLSSDIPGAVKSLRWYGEAIDKIYDEVAPTRTDALALITREPMGVVAAVMPWNFPLYLAYGWKAAPALAVGNSFILKPAEQSPLTALRAAELSLEAGIPEGVFNVVPGLGETAGRALGLHMDVDCITFTGSSEIGKLFLQYAGQSNMKRVSLECGGKSPHIVLADCPNLEKAAKVAAAAIYFNQGEVCNAGSRLIVEEGIKDSLIEKIVAESAKYQPDDPLKPETEMGAIVDEKQMNTILGYIESGHKEGAKLVIGGQRVKAETGGFYVPPTLFDKVDNKMKIAREEIFGPVLSVIGCRGAEDAIRIANDTPYGLAAGIWTRDITLAHRAAKELRAGFVYINTFDQGDMSVPFGGYKQSGFGRDKSLHALDKYCELKSTWVELS